MLKINNRNINSKDDIRIPNNIIYAEYKLKDITENINTLLLNLHNVSKINEEYIQNKKDINIIDKNGDLFTLDYYLNNNK